MCFYYALSVKAQSLKNRYQLKLDLEIPDLPSEPLHYVSGFDFPKMPVILNTSPDTLQALHWGLVPSWVKSETDALALRGKTLNARSDTALTKPSFRNAMRRQRCLVPADGFYEWRTYEGKKYPYFIYIKGKEIFSFAGIWEAWVNRSTGEVLRTFSILTTEANSLMAKIHNTKKRMPVILPQSQERKWLVPDLSEAEMMDLTQPLADNLMEAHPIGKLITSRTANRNTPEVQAAYDYPELPAI